MLFIIQCLKIIIIHQTSDIRQHVCSLMSDVSYQRSDIRCPMFVVWCQTCDVRRVMFVVWCQMSDVDVWCLLSDVRHLMSDVRCVTFVVWCQTFVGIGNTRIFHTLVQTGKLPSLADEQNYSVYTENHGALAADVDIYFNIYTWLQ